MLLSSRRGNMGFMSNDETMDFNFSVPQPPPDGARQVTAEEAEQVLLKRLEESKDDPLEAMWELAQFYKSQNHLDRAGEIFHDMLQWVSDPELKAQIILALGQTAERARDYPLAVQFYRQGVALEPAAQPNWYFIHNNLGFSLNQLGDFVEGEDCCRRAIAIAPERSNAHKNLGLALVGQGRFREAAETFVKATQVNASDPRSLKHLEDLLAEHPNLVAEFDTALRACREAVRVARVTVDEARQKWEKGRPG